MAEGDQGQQGQQQQQQQQQKPWFDGVDPDTLGHMQNRGWDKLTPEKAAIEGIKAHREASKFIGVPPEQLIRLPADKNSPDWDGVYQRLGAAKEEKDYTFDGLKFKDGTDLDEAFLTELRKTAKRNHMSPDAARDFAKTLIGLADREDDSEGVIAQQKVALERKTLMDDWGPSNVDTNLVIARNAAAKLGVKPEAVSALEGQIGYAAVMKMFHTIGTKIGEDAFVRDANNGRPGALTKEQATARKAELMGDVDWRTRYLAGGVKENAEFQSLIKIEVGT